jgi:hypothetical protein
VIYTIPTNDPSRFSNVTASARQYGEINRLSVDNDSSRNLNFPPCRSTTFVRSSSADANSDAKYSRYSHCIGNSYSVATTVIFASTNGSKTSLSNPNKQLFYKTKIGHVLILEISQRKSIFILSVITPETENPPTQTAELFRRVIGTTGDKLVCWGGDEASCSMRSAASYVGGSSSFIT